MVEFTIAIREAKERLSSWVFRYPKDIDPYTGDCDFEYLRLEDAEIAKFLEPIEEALKDVEADIYLETYDRLRDLLVNIADGYSRAVSLSGAQELNNKMANEFHYIIETFDKYAELSKERMRK